MENPNSKNTIMIRDENGIFHPHVIDDKDECATNIKIIYGECEDYNFFKKLAQNLKEFFNW